MFIKYYRIGSVIMETLKNFLKQIKQVYVHECPRPASVADAALARVAAQRGGREVPAGRRR